MHSDEYDFFFFFFFFFFFCDGGLGAGGRILNTCKRVAFRGNRWVFAFGGVGVKKKRVVKHNNILLNKIEGNNFLRYSSLLSFVVLLS